MQTVYLKFLSLLLLVSVLACTKEDIIVENTTVTPDLSNPIMQKLSNQTWYKSPGGTAGETTFVWETQENMPSPSEAMASLLYTTAFQNITLKRDGSSNMLFVPPFFTNVYIHNQGTWQVAETEENAIVLNTKTPVSNTTVKGKVLNLQAKDQLSSLNMSMDFGHRVLDFKFVNTTYVSNDAVRMEAEDFRWIEQQNISTETLNAQDFVGTWASSGFVNSKMTMFYGGDYEKEEIIRVTEIEDLLLSTPTFFSGQAFNLNADGSATIAYRIFETTLQPLEEDILNDKTVVSNATWEVKGNKIFINTDEALFYSLGEFLFHLPVYAEHLTTIGQYGNLPIRIQKYRYYAIEVIEQTNEGFWSRITTNDAIFYAYLFKSRLDTANTINIKNAF